MARCFECLARTRMRCLGCGLAFCHAHVERHNCVKCRWQIRSVASTLAIRLADEALDSLNRGAPHREIEVKIRQLRRFLARAVRRGHLSSHDLGG